MNLLLDRNPIYPEHLAQATRSCVTTWDSRNTLRTRMYPRRLIDQIEEGVFYIPLPPASRVLIAY